MSSSGHPESDGQSERTNRITIEILRSYVNDRNTNWVEFLPLVEIAINNSKSASTGLTPYFINYGFHPDFTAFIDKNPIDTKVPTVESYIKTIKSATETAKENIKQAQTNQKYYADKHRREHHFIHSVLRNMMCNDLHVMHFVVVCSTLCPISRICCAILLPTCRKLD